MGNSLSEGETVARPALYVAPGDLQRALTLALSCTYFLQSHVIAAGG